MVRTAFAPKSIEHQFVKNMVYYPNVLEDIILGDDFDPSSTPNFYVAACRDGSPNSSTENLREHLEKLFEHWFTKKKGGKGRQPRIIVEEFSFSRDDAMVILNRCHMFYCYGIFGKVLAANSLQTPALIQRLRERVQYNEISYFGICGGAKIASCTPHHSGVPPLNLLDGVDIQYDSCVASEHVIPNGSSHTIQMTSGVASFLLLTPTKVVGQSVPCTKKYNQWVDFAAKNSVLLQDLADYKALEWTAYDHLGSTWYFNLRGYSSTWYFNQIAPSVRPKRRWPRRAENEEEGIIHV